MANGQRITLEGLFGRPMPAATSQRPRTQSSDILGALAAAQQSSGTNPPNRSHNTINNNNNNNNNNAANVAARLFQQLGATVPTTNPSEPRQKQSSNARSQPSKSRQRQTPHVRQQQTTSQSHHQFGQRIPFDVMEDLCFRFLYNLPESEKSNVTRICFQVESAHWFYIDFFCKEQGRSDCIQHGMREFLKQIFYHCSFLRPQAGQFDEILQNWRLYKSSVPTYGAILLDSSLEHVLLVQGYFASKNSWGFPKGKINESEKATACAAREVLEETGFQVPDELKDAFRIQKMINDTMVRLYVVPNVPLNYPFAPRTRSEIRKIQWFKVSSLPTDKYDQRDGVVQGNFFTVIPFVLDLQNWVRRERDRKSKNKAATTSGSGAAQQGASTSQAAQIKKAPLVQRPSGKVAAIGQSTAGTSHVSAFSPVAPKPPSAKLLEELERARTSASRRPAGPPVEISPPGPSRFIPVRDDVETPNPASSVLQQLFGFGPVTEPTTSVPSSSPLPTIPLPPYAQPPKSSSAQSQTAAHIEAMLMALQREQDEKQEQRRHQPTSSRFTKFEVGSTTTVDETESRDADAELEELFAKRAGSVQESREENVAEERDDSSTTDEDPNAQPQTSESPPQPSVADFLETLSAPQYLPLHIRLRSHLRNAPLRNPPTIQPCEAWSQPFKLDVEAILRAL